MTPQGVIARAILSNNVRPHMSARDDATAILAALDAAGFAVVPKEPTDAMYEAAGREHETWTDPTDWGAYKPMWRAMLAAAQENHT